MRGVKIVMKESIACEDWKLGKGACSCRKRSASSCWSKLISWWPSYTFRLYGHSQHNRVMDGSFIGTMIRMRGDVPGGWHAAYGYRGR